MSSVETLQANATQANEMNAANMWDDAPAAMVDAPEFASRELIGTVRSVRYFPATDWTLIELTNGQTATAEIEQDELSTGLTYRFFGQWIRHPKYGPQFQVDSFVTQALQDETGTIAYLTRGGIGLKANEARKIWDRYGVISVAKLRNDPEEVANELGLDQARLSNAAMILRRLAEEEPAIIELFGMFSGRGFPRGAVRACIRKWGLRAPAVVRRDPFAMLVAEIKGVGFKRADALFIDLGGNPRRLKRQMFAGWHWMRNAGEGNTWELNGRVARAILEACGTFSPRALTLGVRAGWFDCRQNDPQCIMIAERENAHNERRIADHVKRIQSFKPLWDAELDEALSEHQAEKLRSILHSPIAILAGTPGTGKTHSAAALIRRLVSKCPRPKILVMAPTGKAAVRITEAMRRNNLNLAATTIHSGLGVTGYSSGKAEFTFNESKPLDADLIVVDESSMIDTDIMSALLAAVGWGCNVLLVGDPFQLPPVGHGAPLRDLIAAGIPCALLTEIKRNAGTIVTACKQIKDGQLMFSTDEKLKESEGKNLKVMPAANAEAQAAMTIDLLNAMRGRGYDPVWDVQVLVVRNEGEFVGRKELNVRLQAYLNPEVEADENRRNPRFRKRDKVICLKNTTVTKYEFIGKGADPTDTQSYKANQIFSVYVANGDMGRVLATDPNCAIVEFAAPPRIVKVTTARKKRSKDDDDDERDKLDFDLAYAITTHKSQGSEWPVVLFVLDEGAGRIGCRELIYTGISRAAKLCLLVGKFPVAVKMAAKVELTKRRTFLRELLTENTVAKANEGEEPTP